MGVIEFLMRKFVEDEKVVEGDEEEICVVFDDDEDIVFDDVENCNNSDFEEIESKLKF